MHLRTELRKSVVHRYFSNTLAKGMKHIRLSLLVSIATLDDNGCISDFQVIASITRHSPMPLYDSRRVIFSPPFESPNSKETTGATLQDERGVLNIVIATVFEMPTPSCLNGNGCYPHTTISSKSLYCSCPALQDDGSSREIFDSNTLESLQGASSKVNLGLAEGKRHVLPCCNAK